MDFNSSIVEWMRPERDHFKYSLTFFNQEKNRKQTKRRSLTEIELLYNQAWELCREYYITLRSQTDFLDEIIPNNLRF